MNSRFLSACRREPVDATPVWFMRQAGRYMPQYRAIRARHSLLDICRTPELSTQVTLQPVRAIDVDAAILFSDLLIPLEPMGLRFDFVEGEGPLFENPVRSAEDVARLRRFDAWDELPHVFTTIRLVRSELAGEIPLIGFAGAPFTLAAYAIEGGPSATFARAKSFMFSEPAAWHRLCGLLADTVAEYLAAQVKAGAQAVQLFDSWVGSLSETDYREYVLPHTRSVFDRLAGLDVPTIHFGTGTAMLLDAMREAGGDVIGVDWRIPLDEAWRRIGHDRAIQGNLDPTLLLGPRRRLFEGAGRVLAQAGGRPGHIFNLGHGILPSTSLELVQELARFVHGHTRAARAGA